MKLHFLCTFTSGPPLTAIGANLYRVGKLQIVFVFGRIRYGDAGTRHPACAGMTDGPSARSRVVLPQEFMQIA